MEMGLRKMSNVIERIFEECRIFLKQVKKELKY